MAATMTKECSECGAKIGSNSATGLCGRCKQKLYRQRYEEKIETGTIKTPLPSRKAGKRKEPLVESPVGDITVILDLTQLADGALHELCQQAKAEFRTLEGQILWKLSRAVEVKK